MRNDLPLMPANTETIAELRQLYREAEARSARLRLLHQTGQLLAQANSDTLESTLQSCADRMAFFVGCRAAVLKLGSEHKGLAVRAPGKNGALASVDIDGMGSLDEIPDPADRDTVRMQLDMMGAAIDRVQQEREKTHLLKELRDREKRLETMLDWIFTAQEDERRRISHELHDGVAQTATALVRLLENTNGQSISVNDQSLNPPEVARGLVSELRRVIAGLRPTSLDDLGLVPALRSLTQGLAAEGYRVTERLGSETTRLPTVVENALYRVAQEAIANIRKHAGGPCEVIVEAQLADTDQNRFLRVTDFGKGPSAATRKALPNTGTNVGIEVMRERMTAIGGTLEWRSGHEKGVVVEARLGKAF